MIILGIRLACLDFKSLFTNKVVYLNCALKLIVYPLFAYLLVYFLPLDFAFKASILALSAAPCASVLFNLSEMYDMNQEYSANVVLLSTLLSVITIPLLMLLI